MLLFFRQSLKSTKSRAAVGGEWPFVNYGKAICRVLRVGEQDECTRTHAHIESPPHTHTCTHTCPHTHTGHPQSLGLSFKERCVCLEKTDRVTSCTMSSSASPPRHNAPAVLRTHRRVDSEVVPSSVRP